MLHKHRYKIIGTGHMTEENINVLQVDVICKCGKCGTVYVDKKYEDMVIKQAANDKYLSVPAIIYSESYN